MHCLAIGMQLPIGSCRREILSATASSVLWRGHRDPHSHASDEYLGADFRFREAGRLQQPMQADHAADSSASARQVERTQAHRSRSRMTAMRRASTMGMVLAVARPGLQPLEQHGRESFMKARHLRAAFLVGGAALSLAEVVERETRVALPREPPRHAFHEVVAPAPGVIDEHRGPRTRLAIRRNRKPSSSGFRRHGIRCIARALTPPSRTGCGIRSPSI